MKRIFILSLLCLSLTGCFIAENTKPNFSNETAAATAPVLLTYTLYTPNENADGFVTQTVQTDAIHADSILAMLQRSGVLPETVAINNFGIHGDRLEIDFNESFADAINAMGTSGEYMIIGSTVNTFLNAYQAQSVTITVEGQIFESGHVIYDFPLTFYE